MIGPGQQRFPPIRAQQRGQKDGPSSLVTVATDFGTAKKAAATAKDSPLSYATPVLGSVSLPASREAQAVLMRVTCQDYWEAKTAAAKE